MAVCLRAAVPADTDRIAALLGAAFNAPADSWFADRRLLHWKYFDRFGSRSLPRSYVLVQNETIVAHCVASPMTLCVPHPEAPDAGPERLSAVCFMDWVGDRDLPGAGVILMKKLMAQVDVAIVVGGSKDSRQVVPRLGYACRDRIAVFARVLRPVRQARSRPSAGLWRDAARLVRNAAWSRTPLGPIDPDWRVTPVSAFGPLQELRLGSGVHAEHTPDILNYWLRCPAAEVTGFDIYRRSELFGRFLLSRVAGQVRVAGIWLRTSARGDWEQAYRLATASAAEQPSACEIVAFASTPAECSALQACGFRRRDARPVFVYDPRGRLTGAPPLVWSPIDDDAAYVYDPSNPYRT